MNETGQDSDEILMGRIKGGDRQAFAVLVRRHTDRFYAAAYRLCGRPDEAEDVVQDAFLKLWDRPDVYDPARGAKFTTWFYRVVTNLTLDRMRRRRKQAGGDVLELMADKAPRADETLVLNEEQAGLEAAIQALPERQKAALNLCFYEGLSNKEAADILGVGVKGLESLLMRAKAGVRENLTKQGLINREKAYG